MADRGNISPLCSYCYFGGLADELDIKAHERQEVLPSLYEGFAIQLPML